MAVANQPAALKVVGSNGQISLGKQYAGRYVLAEESEPGVWIVRTATVIPDNERWLHEGAAGFFFAAERPVGIVRPVFNGAE